jgi:hypothetical protein
MQLYHTVLFAILKARTAKGGEKMAKGNNGFLIFHDWKILFTHTPDEDCKRILLAMFEYSQSGTEPPQFEGVAEITASVIFPAIKRYRENVELGRRGGLASAKKARSEGTVKGTTEGGIEGGIEGATDNKTIQNKTRPIQDKTIQHTPIPILRIALPLCGGRREGRANRILSGGWELLSQSLSNKSCQIKKSSSKAHAPTI